jgi:pimeloyl-ACP methyl ester carboxylesterase
MLKAWYAMPLPEGMFPVAIDLPGHGASGGVVPDSVEAISEFLNAFLNTLGIRTPICYIGHSAGGLIGLQFALMYPERVNLLTLIATFARIQLHPDFLHQAITGQWDYTLLRQSFASEIPEEVQNLVLDEFQHLRLSQEATDFMGLSDHDLCPALPALQMPTLVITGDDDVIISPRKSPMLQKQLPQAELMVVPGAGHYVHVEQAETVAAIVSGFLQRSQPVEPEISDCLKKVQI